MPRSLPVSLILLGLAAAVAAAAAPERSPATPTAKEDSRLGVRLALRSPGFPLARVTGELGRAAGVSLEVGGRLADERLVAFVPGAPLAEVMACVAELYRGEWTRIPAAGGARYRLARPAAREREERALRDRALRKLLAALGERLRNPRGAPAELAPGMPDPWRPVYPTVFPAITAGGETLLREGYLYLPISRLPDRVRERFLAQAQPILARQDALRAENHRRLRSQWIEKGVPEPALEPEDDPLPPTRAHECTLTTDFQLLDEPRVSIGLRTPPEGATWFNWFELRGDDLRVAGVDLYTAHEPSFPIRPVSEESPAPSADRFDRLIDVPPVAAPRPGDWIDGLRRLSAAAGTAIYADCYPTTVHGVVAHPRGPFAPAPRTTVSRELSRICFPGNSQSTSGRQASSFWWRRGDAALVRSRRWLWDETQVLPAALVDRVAEPLTRRRTFDPEALPTLGALSALQVQGLGPWAQFMDEWRLAVRVPSRLSASARRLYLEGTVTAEQFGPEDRRQLAILAPDRELRTLRWQRPFVELIDGTAQGGAIASVFFRAPGAPGGRPAHFVLPGVGPPPALERSGIEVRRLD